MNYIEKLISRRVVDELIKRGEPITVSGERGYDYNETFEPNIEEVDKIIASADQYDEAHIFVGGSEKEGFGPFVYLIFGNGNGGWDVISDYSTSLEDTLRPVMDFVLEEGD
jgi:hypothetical protein